MNALGIDREILRYATGWETAYASRVIIGLLGVLILSITARAAWKRDCAVLTAVLWVILGSGFVAFSIVPQRLITFVVSTDYVTRIRFIMGGLSILVLLITLESIRRTVLMERYALLWIVTALAILFCALFPEAVALFRAVTGMEYATAIVAVAFTFLVLVAFHFSISLSSMQSKQTRIAQRLAILEVRLRGIEEAAEKKRAGCHPETEDAARK